MPKQEESKTVSYTKDQMFDLVADIDRYHEFLPWCNNSKIINTKKVGDEKIVIADLEIGYDKSQINVRNLDGPFKYLENSWKFTAINDFECEIQFNIDFELNVSLLDIMMKKFFDQKKKKMVDAFIARANEIY